MVTRIARFLSNGLVAVLVASQAENERAHNTTHRPS